MPNPYLPKWEYIPDGEPRVFGDRVYVYGSHDRTGSDSFCDYIIKAWSAPVNDLNKWTCQGVAFRTRTEAGDPCDAPWTNGELYAPDVVEKDGKYYLYAYIFYTRGCVAVSDRPEGPFKLISTYQVPPNSPEHLDNGVFVDPGVLVDDDDRVYVYCGFEGSFMAELSSSDMVTVIDGTYIKDIIPTDEPHRFFEACSPRKVGDTYYMIYSPKTGSQLVYATSDSPRGPFEYRGVIVDNGIHYPGGNNHGSICLIDDQWYIFYHRMTNNTIMSRRGCVEKIQMLPDGTIPQVEMTSLGFDDFLSPYYNTPAEIACHLTGGCFITEKDLFTRVITQITDGSVMGYKYFDFGDDFTGEEMFFRVHVNGMGMKSTIKLMLDAPENGQEIGSLEIGLSDGVYECKVKNTTGRHALYLVANARYGGPFIDMFKGRQLFELKAFSFDKR